MAAPKKSKKRAALRTVPRAARNATPPEKADVAIVRALAPYSDSLPVRLLTAVGKLGDQPPMLTLSAMTLAAGLAGGNRRLARAGLRMVAAHLLATGAKNFIKRRVDRTRPQVLVEEGRYRMERGRHQAGAVTSFPSGHTAGAVAVARAFAREYPEHAPAAYAGAGAIALAQIPRCRHYPTDVAAGAAIGLLGEAVAARVLPRGPG